jgi:hypothetical protein
MEKNLAKFKNAGYGKHTHKNKNQGKAGIKPRDFPQHTAAVHHVPPRCTTDAAMAKTKPGHFCAFEAEPEVPMVVSG